MPALQVVSAGPLQGKSTVAVALAQGFSRAGSRVRLLRTGGGDAAHKDALTLAAFLFADSAGRPLAFDELPAPREGEALIVETDAGTDAPGLPAIVVVRGGVTEADKMLATSLGDRLLGTIATRVVASATETVARDLTNANLRPLALIPEDRTLAAPSVGELREILGAELLYDGENAEEVVEDVLIAPVYADPARPHFRRFASKAVLAPYNKTDLHLVAIETQAACLVITGGRQPSPYVIDRAQHDSTTVLLAPKETPETVAALGSVWLTSRFRGERKAAAALAHLDGKLDFAALLRRLQG